MTRSYQSGIIPAYAGSTTPPGESMRVLRDHPRIRGEHSWRLTDAMVEGGSSPHTRGALSVFDMTSPFWGIIPAYAGSTVRLLQSFG